MTTSLNPYEPASLPQETVVLLPSLGFASELGVAILFGMQAAGGAGVIAYVLFFIVLSLPSANYLGFRIDFEVAWLFGGTLLAVAGGFLGGIARVLSPRTRRWASIISYIILPSLLLILYGLFNLDELLSCAVAIIIILLASLWADIPVRLLFPSFHSRWSAYHLSEGTAILDQQCTRSLWLSMAGFLVPSALMVLAMLHRTAARARESTGKHRLYREDLAYPPPEPRSL